MRPTDYYVDYWQDGRKWTIELFDRDGYTVHRETGLVDKSAARRRACDLLIELEDTGEIKTESVNDQNK